ncbi:hypothetical protein I9W82_004829 [Candida metapsilosis]|uniref:Uncharacterized protein n=1 Tax=Candida metapsilosis TaxID=273372 RepID=A0A8H7ZE54_9ASCO|nr:hypothetical protein I9W82_004829 [Candida metapsilosis]
MPHPGRPKGRMNKKTMQQAALARQQAAQMQAAQANRAAQEQLHHHPHHLHGRHEASNIKEEAGIQLHDEADLITYRNDALIRYMSNHEYIENVTAKPIHSSKISPPSLYPTLPKRNADDYANVNPEEIYYGDIEYMKYFDEQLTKSLSVMRQEDDPGFVRYLFNTDNYPYKRAKFTELANLQQELKDRESVDKLAQGYESILQECREKFHQEYKFQASTKVYSIPVRKLTSDVKVQRAPDDYNPKDFDPVGVPNEPSPSPAKEVVVSNAGEKGNGEQGEAPSAIDDNGFNSNDIDLDLDTNADDMFQFVDEGNENFENITSSVINGSNVTSQAQKRQEHETHANALGLQDNETGSTGEPLDAMTTAAPNQNTDTIRSGTNGLSTDEPQKSSQQSPETQQPMDQNNNQNANQPNDGDDDDQLNDAMVAEINDLFNDDDHGMDHHSGIVNDDIGDLYNFDQGDNGDLLGGSEFEQDFLSQINQSME